MGVLLLVSTLIQRWISGFMAIKNIYIYNVALWVPYWKN